MNGSFVHEAGLYGSDAELVELVAPLVEAGVSAGDPTFLVLAPRTRAVVGAAVDLSAVTLLGGGEQYRRPATTLRDYRDLVAERIRAGAHRVRVVGELPPSILGGAWDGWARYEAAANHALGGFPVHGLCLYDARTTPEHVLADVVRTHPHVGAERGGHRANPDYVDPGRFLFERSATAVPRTAGGSPAVEVVDPSPGGARRVVAQLAERCRLAVADRDGLVTSVSEAVGNARRHGRPPVLLQVWMAPGRIEVAVHDTGPGPRNPFAGLVPEPPEGGGGLGLWLVHQLCAEVTLTRSPAGFAVRMRAGGPGH